MAHAATAPPLVGQDTAPAVLGDSLRRAGRCDRAFPVYEQALAEVPDDGLSALWLGVCRYRTEDLEGALRWFRAAAAAPELRAEGHAAVAGVLARLGLTDEALTALEIAVEAGYDNGDQIRSDPDIALLEGKPRYRAIMQRTLGEGYLPDDTIGLTPDRVRQGVDMLLSEVERRHPNPYRRFPPRKWNERAERIKLEAEELTAAAYYFRMAALLYMAGDVHSSVYPSPESKLFSYALPVRFWHFADGLFVRAAAPGFEHLVGAEILRAGSYDIEHGWNELLDYFATENRSMSENRVQFFMLFPEFHRTMGWGENVGGVPFTVRLADGTIEQVLLPAAEGGGYSTTQSTALGIAAPEGWREGHVGVGRLPLWLQHRRRNYWFEVLPADSALYLAVNLSRSDRERPWEEFLDEVFDIVEQRGLERLIIDLRHNPGGYGYMAQALTHRVIRSERINRPGHVFVLTSRSTQSAGVTFAVQLEMHTFATFAGEPLAAHPNFFNSPMGHATPKILPGTELRFQVASEIEQESDHLDTRETIWPDFPVRMTYAQYATGEDPVLARVIEVGEEEARQMLSDPGGRLLPLYFHWRRPSQAEAFPGGYLPRRY